MVNMKHPDTIQRQNVLVEGLPRFCSVRHVKKFPDKDHLLPVRLRVLQGVAVDNAFKTVYYTLTKSTFTFIVGDEVTVILPEKYNDSTKVYMIVKKSISRGPSIITYIWPMASIMPYIRNTKITYIDIDGLATGDVTVSDDTSVECVGVSFDKKLIIWIEKSLCNLDNPPSIGSEIEEKGALKRKHKEEEEEEEDEKEDHEKEKEKKKRKKDKDDEDEKKEKEKVDDDDDDDDDGEKKKKKKHHKHEKDSEHKHKHKHKKDNE